MEYFATKYDSARDEVIALLADEMTGYGRSSTGDVDAPTGWFAVVFLDESCDLDFSDTTGAYPVGDEVGELARMFGVTALDVAGSHIVTHNSQGFVSVESFASQDEAREEFNCRAGRYEEWSDEDRDEDSDGVYMCPVTGHGYHSL